MWWRILAFVALAALSLLGSIQPVLIPVAVLGFVAWIAVVWTDYVISRLRIRHETAERAFTGEELLVRMVIRNSAWLPASWVRLRDDLPPAIELRGERERMVSLGARSSRTVTGTALCKHRGYHRLGPVHATTGDPIGVTERSTDADQARRLIVYPRIVPLERLGLPSLSAQTVLPTRCPLMTDPTRVTGLRAFQTGDPVRHIHWTASARTGELLVKKFQPAQARDTLIALALDPPDYGAYGRHDASEVAIVVAASLAYHITVNERLPVGLLTEAFDPLIERQERILLPVSGTQGQLQRILEVLARIQMRRSGTFAADLTDISRELSWGSTVVVIAGMLREELALSLLSLRSQGHPTALILVESGKAVPGGGEAVLPAEVPVFRVKGDVELAAPA